MSLADELKKTGGEALVTAVATAIGPVVPSKDATFTTVECFYIDHSVPDVVGVYLVSAGRLIRHEQAKTGAALTVCLGLSRVARVSQQTDVTPAAKVTVVIEVAADRTTLSGIAQTRPAGADGAEPGVTVLTGNLFPAGWVLETSEPAAMGRLAAFATRVRACLAN